MAFRIKGKYAFGFSALLYYIVVPLKTYYELFFLMAYSRVLSQYSRVHTLYAQKLLIILLLLLFFENGKEKNFLMKPKRNGVVSYNTSAYLNYMYMADSMPGENFLFIKTENVWLSHYIKSPAHSKVTCNLGTTRKSVY